MLSLPWTRPAVFKTLHKAHKYPPQREESSLILFVTQRVHACFVPLLDALPSIFRKNSTTTSSSNTFHLSTFCRYRQLRIPRGKHYKSKRGTPIQPGQSNERVVCGSITWLIITSLSFLCQTTWMSASPRGVSQKHTHSWPPPPPCAPFSPTIPPTSV